MKIAILTSSRADYGIYYPLIKALYEDPFFFVSIIAFGTHLSEKHGYTIKKIEDDGFAVAHAIKTFPENDLPGAIAESMAKTMTAFTTIWEKSNFDIVFCLGDRYEMFAACSSATLYNIKLAHLHGGEQTLGAIDDAFRHAITHMSSYHFAAAEIYKQRVIQLKGIETNIYNVGSLSIDNLKKLNLYDIPEFNERFGIDMSIPSILVTFHPETVSFTKNERHVSQLVSALEEINDYQIIITMPNADTMGDLIRKRLRSFIERTNHAIGIESFGTLGYLSCMKHCRLLLGNTSSGYIEASFFPKYVIDIGSRQTGRIVTGNIHRCGIEKDEILRSVNEFKNYFHSLSKIDIYGEGNTAEKIITIIKEIHG